MNTEKEDTKPPSKEKEESVKNATKDFETMVAAYLASNPVRSVGGKSAELEIRFGTNSKQARPISKIDYENVVKQLYSAGFTCGDSRGLHILRIQNEYFDQRRQEKVVSNIRAEVVGIDLIQGYCKHNDLNKLINDPANITISDNKFKFTQKTQPTAENGERMRPVDLFDYNFRMSYQLEQDFSIKAPVVKSILDKWTESKKLFRHINRVRFAHPTYPVFADISIVKGSRKSGKAPIPQYLIQDAGVFQNPETYEIELEIDNSRVGIGSEYDTTAKLMDAIRKCIRIVLSGLQGTNYPISYSQREAVLQDYMRVLYGKEYNERRVTNGDFTGPSSNTLQVKNLLKNNGEINILENYTVTDKADGERRLLFINETGHLYMIDMNMNVIFTGAVTKDKVLYNTIVDGELIKYDKKGEYINLYAAFDVYYIHGKSVREYAFIRDEGDEETSKNKFRLYLLEDIMSRMKPISVVNVGKPESEVSSSVCDFHVKCKNFYETTKNISIFDRCANILYSIDQGLYEYNTDGLIFTPSNCGVGSDKVGVAGKITKTTWDRSFKWKPSKYNTIDFLVSIKKDKTGSDLISTMFESGKGLLQTVTQYKTLVLKCGFDRKRHMFENPFESMISDVLPNQEYDNEHQYEPVDFKPTNPYDPEACFCNIRLLEGEIMKTEEGENIEDNTIVEFRYDMDLDGYWKWVPLRVRYDKTASLRAGRNEFGNAYHVANSNWHSIHHPVTDNMIRNGRDLPEVEEDDDVYYNRSNEKTSTQALRDFHNLFVKKRLIMSVAKRKDTLVDFAMGKGGDLPKWMRAKLGFVFGVDISRDNIFNSLDGACARYLKAVPKGSVDDFPKAIFLHGNSSQNIRNGAAFSTEKEKAIAKAIFGQGPRERKELKDGVYRQYGVGQDGFNVSSCQFALHYFFEDNVSFHNFLRNVSECTAVNGYFVGTCYDGKTVFKKLAKKRNGEGVAIMRQDRKIYEIVKKYDQTGFPDDELSVGYKIEVFQDSINKTFAEYLVNFDYFMRMMENYGFKVLTSTEAQNMGLPNGSGLFSELFSYMEEEVRQSRNAKSEYRQAFEMTDDEKWISFMNRYFVFRKVHHVDADKIYKQFVSRQMLADKEKEVSENVIQLVAQVEDPKDTEKKDTEKKNPKIRKTAKPKIVLDKYSPVDDTDLPKKEDTVKNETTVIPTDIVLPPPPTLTFGKTMTIKKIKK